MCLIMAHSDIFKFNMENSIAICNAFLIENLLFYQFKKFIYFVTKI